MSVSGDYESAQNALKVDFTRAATVSRKVAASAPWRGGMAPTVHSPLTVRLWVWSVRKIAMWVGDVPMKTDF